MEIVGSRIYRGEYQYEVLYEGKDEVEWVAADKLDCIDLIEEFEANK